METKKTVRADLHSKSSFFLSIGLLVGLALVVMAFEWKQYDESLVDLNAKSTNNFDELIEILSTDLPVPPRPPLVAPVIVVVTNDVDLEDIKINLNIEGREEDKVGVMVVKAEELKEEVDEIFPFVEESATPKGGLEAFYKYIGDKMRYPAAARRMGIEGKVFVEFVINKDGSISDVRIVKGIGAGCDEEAIRVLQGAPFWSPGKQRGKPVKQRMVIPIVFKLS